MYGFSKITIISAFTCLCFLAAPLALAGPYEDARKAYKEKDYATAQPIFQSLAEDGNPDAQFYLGAMYDLGLGVEKSNKQALKWYKRAAKAGDSTAQFNLALMYENGEGVKVNLKRAYDWYLKSAQQGDAGAQYSVAFAYYGGNGVKKSNAKAISWFKKAADQGHLDSITELGFMYYQGIGVDVDYSRAARLFETAAAEDHVQAKAYLGALYHVGNGVSKDMDEAIRLFSEAAAVGNKFAIDRLEYIEGEKREEERHQRRMAEIDAELAALKSARESAVRAAGPLDSGIAAYHAKDYVRALPIIQAHAENSDAIAQTFLGAMFRDGNGVKQSDGKANSWFLKAGKNGSGEAYYLYANMCYAYRVPSLSQYTNPWGHGFEAMEKSAALGYQPAKDFLQKHYDEKKAEKKAEEFRRAELAKKEAEANRRRAAAAEENRRAGEEHQRKYGDGVSCKTSLQYDNQNRPSYVTTCN